NPSAGNPRGLFVSGFHKKYSCSKPNQKSASSSSMSARPLVGWGVPSAFSTSVITSHPSFRSGSGKRATGFKRQSDDPPGACWVELPSKDHRGQSSNLPLNLETILVLLRRLWVGLYPSSQMYSSLVLAI